MLDTDTCAFILRRSSDTLLARIQAVPVVQQAMSVVTYAELLYGVQVSSKKKANQAAVDALARHVAGLAWPQEAAKHYAQIRADLKKKGSMIGANDLLIAAHGRNRRNEKHQGLRARQRTQGRKLDELIGMRMMA